MSHQLSFEFKNFIPHSLYSKYFDTMTTDKNVFICIVQNESQVGAIYLEKPEKNGADVEGVIRVFFTSEDLKRYGKSVALTEGIPFEFVRRWEMKFTEFVEYIHKMDANYKSRGKKGVRAVASAVHDEKFVDLDVLWTAESDFMV